MSEKQDYEEKWPNLPVKYLILSTDEFIVFIDDDYDLDWKTSEEFDRKGFKDQSKHNEIMNNFALIESIPNHHLQKEIRLNFKRMLGESIIRSFQNDYNNAETMLLLAKSFVIARNQEKSRYWYITASGLTTLIFAIIGILIWIFRIQIIPLLGISCFYTILSMTAGAIGALLSIIIRIGNIALDCNAGRNIHYLESFYKIISGSISGLLISLLVKAGLIIPIFSKLDKTHLAMILAAFIAGSSERFIPTIIKKIENTK